MTGIGAMTGIEAMTGIPEDAIAVVGMAGRFPGARGVGEFWRNVRGGVESVTRFGAEELAAEGVAPEVVAHPDYVPAKGVLDDVDRFDAGFFELTAREAELMDPQHRVFLECAWEALESAGYDPGRSGDRVGLYAGQSAPTYLLAAMLADPAGAARLVADFSTQLGNVADFLATRTAYKLDLRGPVMTVQTACSTSLVAVHLACQSLLVGECGTALAGGVSITVPHRVGTMTAEGGILSADGHCRAYSEGAGGTVGGSGAGVVVLRRLADAVAAGDRIWGVIRGSAVNNDGGVKVGYTAPSVGGQVEVISEALAVSGVDVSSIGFVEGHGTGTVLGDPIEVSALTEAWRAAGGEGTGWCALGSVKSNIGHLDAAAGVTGLIKAVLALDAGVVPPTVHFAGPPDLIDFASSPFFVNADAAPWPVAGGPRRAAVSSFGIGGTNAHVVLEQAPDPQALPEEPGWELLTVSGRSAAAVAEASAGLAGWLRDGSAAGLAGVPSADAALSDVAFTLQTGRRRFAHRRVVVCRDRAEAVAALEGPDGAGSRRQEDADRSVAFLLPDLGSEYTGMGRDLSARWPVFRAEVDRCVELLGPDAGRDVRAVLDGTGTGTGPGDGGAGADVARRALFVVEYALARMWMSWGVVPSAVLGRGIGEQVARCLAGELTPAEALRAAPAPDGAADARFSDALGPLLADPDVVLLEVGPGTTLESVVHSLDGPGGDPGDAVVLRALGELWLAGVDIEWAGVHAGQPRRRVALPTYPFERRRYWIADPPAAVSAQPGERRTYERPELDTPFEAPRDDLETSVTALWNEALGFRDLGIHDDFYDLGGDSLVAMQLAGRIKETFLVEFPVDDVLEHPTVAAQAERIRAGLVAMVDTMTDDEVEQLLAGDRGGAA